MDNSNKYLQFNHKGKDAYEIVDEVMTQYKNPLFAIKKIREIFPNLSLIEAKEIVIIRTTNYKSLYDYQGSFLPDLEELDRLFPEEKECGN